MRQNTICIYEHKLMYVVAGQLYDLQLTDNRET